MAFLNSVVSLAHALWEPFLSPGALVVDATAGNGGDTLFLAQKVLTPSSGKLIALDIQQKALDNTLALLQDNLPPSLLSKVELVCICHSLIQNYGLREIDLIVYNLGYLPGEDKTLTTEASTTLLSLQAALNLLKKGGLLSVTCYPGHSKGWFEAQEVLNWAKSLGADYVCCQHSWINRSDKSPFILLIYKK